MRRPIAHDKPTFSIGKLDKRSFKYFATCRLPALLVIQL